MRGCQWIVTRFKSVGIEQQLVRIETMAGAIHVGDESGGRSRRPGFIKEPVRSPGAIAVIDRVPNRGRGLEGSVRLPIHGVTQHGTRIHRGSIDPKLDTGGRGGVNTKSHFGISGKKSRTEE